VLEAMADLADLKSPQFAGHRESPDIDCSHKMIENVGPVASPRTGVDGGWTAY
jgi:hypothetical protein